MKSKPSKSIRTVGIIANRDKPSAHDAVRAAHELIRAGGRFAALDAGTAEISGVKARVFPTIKALAHAVDLLLVFGGDGTMLRVAREVAGSHIPLLGINLGSLGFLTDVPSAELRAALEQVWRGDFTLETRALIEARNSGPAGTLAGRALNDIVISRGKVSRLIELEVCVDDDFLTRYRGDGLIVSTPTGSTAYSLAAGGAVVFPTANVFVITPICAHTLSSRSVVVSLDSTVHVRIISDNPHSVMSADGEGENELGGGNRVTIRRSRHSIQLVQLQGTSFFETLRRKLQWSGSNIMAP